METKCCPQLMSDGRAFTDYRPRCMQTYTMCSYENRQYLQANAEKLMQENHNKFYNENKCTQCMEPYNEGTMLNEQNIVSCDKNTCRITVKDPSGLGNGRMNTYPVDSNTKKFLMNKEIENTEKCINGYDDPLFYSYDREFETCNRQLHPSGMIPKCKK